MREPPDIPEESLRDCLLEQYGLTATTLEFLPVGLDMMAGVYRVATTQGSVCLLKAMSGPFYAPNYLVPRYLADQGIEGVVAPLPTKAGYLWTEMTRERIWRLALYPFIEGHTGWTPSLTDAQWRVVGTTTRRIHQVALPAGGFPSLRSESFDVGEYARWVRTLDAQVVSVEGQSEAERTLRANWSRHRSSIFASLTALESLAAVLRERAGPYVVCHADLHPGNLIRDHAAGVWVIDWNDVMLAPKERDFIFIGQDRAGDAAREGAAQFFRAYGQAEIDWVALTYYRYERLMQDVIAFAQEVFERDDLAEDTKAESARFFGQMFAPGNALDAALAAATHLPPDIPVSDAGGK